MKKEAILIVVIVALVGLLVGGVLYNGTRGGTEAEGAAGPDPFRPENLNALPSVEGGTREALAGAIATPEVAGVNGNGAEMDPDALPIEGEVAIPESVQKVGTQARRVFSLAGEGDKFTPANIIVNEGDIVVIKVTARDKDYDIFFPDFGIYRFIGEGETQQISFQAYPFGDYRFFCENECAGRPAGRLVVNGNQ